MRFKITLPKILLGFIIILALFLRLYSLSDIPSGFFADEASIGHNAYTILTKGVDEYGTPHPFFFRAFGEFKSPVEIYSTVPFVAIFGLNEFSVRIPSAIFGSITIIVIYFLTKELLLKHKNKKIAAFIAALFLAISPWHIHFSRIAFEMMPFVFFTTLGLCLFLKSQKGNFASLILSVICFTIALYSYFPARIFIPLFGIGIFCVYHKFFWQHKKETILSFAIAILLLMPFISHSFSSSGFSRWQQVNIFSQPPKNESVAQHIFSNYISHFSADFLFFKGDIDMPGQFITRHSIRGMGELYLFQLPLIILGVLFLIRKKTYKAMAILFLWLALYPIGSMFTTDQNAQATRSIIGVVPFQILSAIGLSYLIISFLKLKKVFSYISALVIAIIIFASFVYYLNLYFIKYPLYSSDFWGWQFGARDIAKYFTANEQNYDQLIMAPEFNAPGIFFKFYAPQNCLKYQVGTPDKLFDRRYKQLFAVTPSYLANFQHKFITKKILYYPNKNIAFQIGEVVQ